MFIFDPHVHMDLSSLDKKNLEEIKRMEQIQWFVEVAKLTPGQTFGELALINREPRSASIMCICNCYFATLEKQDYLKVLKKIELREIDEKTAFFAKLPFLKFFTRAQIRRSLNMFRLKHYVRN